MWLDANLNWTVTRRYQLFSVWNVRILNNRKSNVRRTRAGFRVIIFYSNSHVIILFNYPQLTENVKNILISYVYVIYCLHKKQCNMYTINTKCLYNDFIDSFLLIIQTVQQNCYVIVAAYMYMWRNCVHNKNVPSLPHLSYQTKK